MLDKNQYDEQGKRHGYWELYRTNGSLWYICNYVNGEVHGLWESYYSNGKIYYKEYYAR